LTFYFVTHFLNDFHLSSNIFETQTHQVAIYYTRTEERQIFAFAVGNRRRNKGKLEFFFFSFFYPCRPWRTNVVSLQLVVQLPHLHFRTSFLLLCSCGFQGNVALCLYSLVQKLCCNMHFNLQV